MTIDEFCTEVEISINKTGRHPSLNVKNAFANNVRWYDKYQNTCPITFLANYKFRDRTYRLDDFRLAGKRLGLDEFSINKIMMAADYQKEDMDLILRKRMLSWV